MVPTANPDTLPANFFSGGGKTSNPNPDTLPADFFSKPQGAQGPGAQVSQVGAKADSAGSRMGSSYLGGMGIPQTWDELKQVGKAGLVNVATMGASSSGQMVWNAAKNAYEHIGQAGAALARMDRGSINDALGHYAGAVPIFGPIAYKAGEQASRGDIAGSVGTTGAGLTQAVIPEVVGRTGTALRGATGDLLPRFTATMKQALRPRPTQLDFDRTLQRAGPEINASQQATSTPVQDVDTLLSNTRHAKQRVWDQYQQMLGPRAQIGRDMTPVADAIDQSIPSIVEHENPARAEAVHALADKYRGKTMRLDEIEDFLQQSNAQLAGFEAQYPAVKIDKLTADPDIAATKAKADALRNVLYSALDDPGEGAAPREVKLRYGALSEVEQTAMRRKVIAERQAPQNLTDQLSKVGAGWQVAKGIGKILTLQPKEGLIDIGSAIVAPEVAKWVKQQNSTNGLIKRSFANYQGAPSPINAPPPNTPGIYSRPTSVEDAMDKLQQVNPNQLPAGAVRMPPVADTSGGKVTTGEPLSYGGPRQLTSSSAPWAVNTKKPLALPAGSSGKYPIRTLITPAPADTSGGTVTTGPPLTAPLKRQLNRGPLTTPPPRDSSGTILPSKPTTGDALEEAVPVIDSQTGKIVYYTRSSLKALGIAPRPGIQVPPGPPYNKGSQSQPPQLTSPEHPQ